MKEGFLYNPFIRIQGFEFNFKMKTYDCGPIFSMQLQRINVKQRGRVNMP